MQLAFVIKNHTPYDFRVVLLHQTYGKIVCRFNKTDQAVLLTSGSLIWCTVQKNHITYKIIHLEIESQVAIQNLKFMHDIMKLCLHGMPTNIAAPEFFDFLLYVQKNVNKFSEKSQKIALLRVFLMLDLLVDDEVVLQVAILDPAGKILQDKITLEKYIKHCWNNFFQIKSL